jgi:beta-phosphoglucomutase-like phosphatase (HAD superfamily)
VISGIIFDFDGLIVDTEWPIYQSWVELFKSVGATLPLDQWTSVIGTSSFEHFDPFELMQPQVARTLDRKRLTEKRRDRELTLTYAQPILPGVEEALKSAQALNLRLAIASSSDRKWVEGNLNRLGLLEYFRVVHTESLILAQDERWRRA